MVLLDFLITLMIHDVLSSFGHFLLQLLKLSFSLPSFNEVLVVCDHFRVVELKGFEINVIWSLDATSARE